MSTKNNNILKGSHTAPSSSLPSIKPQRDAPRSALAFLFFSKVSLVLFVFLAYSHLHTNVLSSLNNLQTNPDNLPMSLPWYMLNLLLGSTTVLLLIQRPWNGKALDITRFIKLLKCGSVLLLSMYTWIFGMLIFGPFRSLTLEGAEIPLFYLYAILIKKEKGSSKRKNIGTALMILAYIFLIWDRSGRIPHKMDQITKLNLEKGADKLERAIHNHNPQKFFQDIKDTTNHVKNRTMNLKGKLVSKKIYLEPTDLRQLDDDGIPGDDDQWNQRFHRSLLQTVNSLHTNSGRNNATQAQSSDEFQHVNASAGMNSPELDNELDHPRLGLSTSRNSMESVDSDIQLVSLDVSEFSFGKEEPLQIWKACLAFISLLVTPFMNQYWKNYNRRLAIELGGAKRHFVLSLTAALLINTPIAFFSAFLNYKRGVIYEAFWTTAAFRYILVGTLWLVIPFYFRSFSSLYLSQRFISKSGAFLPFLIAAFYKTVFGYQSDPVGVTVLTVLAYIMVIIGLSFMTASNKSDTIDQSFPQA